MRLSVKVTLGLSLILFLNQGCTENPLSGFSNGSKVDDSYHPGLAPGKFAKLIKIKQGDNQTGVAHTSLGQIIKVQVLDLDGVYVPDTLVQFKITTGGGTLSSEQVQTDADGVAETTWTLGTLAGTQTLTAYSESLGIDKGVFLTATAIADSPSASHSTITSSSGSVIANGTDSAQITINLKDAYNNPIINTIPTFAATDTAATNHYGTCSATNNLGESFCTLTSLKAELKTLSLVSPVSVTASSILFTHGPATHLAFVTQPSGANAGVAFTTQPVVQILDANNNLVSSGVDSSALLTMTLASGSGNLSGSTVVLSVLGQAIWSDLQIDAFGTKTLTATKSDLTASGGAPALTVTSISFTNTQNPPAIPTGLVASATTGTINLNWTASSGATSYNIFRGTSSGNLTLLSTSVTNSYSDSTVVNGTIYYYSVQATNINGTSSNSSELQVKPLGQPSVSSISVNGASSMTIVWSSVVGADNFTVKVSTTSGSASTGTTGCTTSSPTLSCNISGLVAGTTYYFSVIGSNNIGSGLNLASTESAGVPLGAFTMTALSPITNGATVSWGAAAGQTSYDILYDTSSHSSSGTYAYSSTGIISGVSISSLTSETTYYFRVRANNSYGSLISTNELSVTTPDVTPPTITLTGAPTSPSNTTSLNVTIGGTDVVSYKYKVGTSASTDCSSSTGYTTVADLTAITDSIAGLSDGNIKLCAVGVDTAGNWQPYASATTATWVKDTTAPTVTSITSDLADATVYGTGTTINITVNFSETVTVASGTPSLSLNIANGLATSPSKEATYVSGSNSTGLVFRYTIQDLDHSNKQTLDYSATSALKLNGATIRDEVLNNADLNLPAPGQSGSLSSGKTYIINALNMVTITSTKACAITPARVLKCWGAGFGAGGTNATTAQEQNAGTKYQSTTVFSHLTVDGTWQNGSTFADLDPGTKYKAIDTDLSNQNRCGITVSNKLRCWGSNVTGILGTGDSNSVATPTTIDPSANYKAVSLSWKYALGLRENGDVYGWGFNSNGACGMTGLGDINYTPVPIVNEIGLTLTGFESIYTPKVGNGGSFFYACGIKSSPKGLHCWGDPDSGFIIGAPAIGTTVQILSSTEFRSFDAHRTGNPIFNCAVSITGTLMCGSIVYIDSFSFSDSGYLSVSGYSNGILSSFACAATTDGKVKCWGSNTSGQAGQGNTTSPVAVPSLVSGF